MQRQTNTQKAARPDRRARPRLEFIAAVRFCDGRRELFKVKDAVDADDARAMVLAELVDAATVIVAPRY